MFDLIPNFVYGFLITFLIQYILFLFIVKRPLEAQAAKVKPKIIQPTPEALISFESMSRKRLNGKFSSSLKTLDLYTQKESCLWLNSIIARLYSFWAYEGRLARWFNKKVGSEIWEVKHCSIVGQIFMDEFKLTGFLLPEHPFYVTKISSCSSENDNDSIVLLLELNLDSPLSITLQGIIKYVRWPFEVKLRVDKLKGLKLYFRYNRAIKAYGWSIIELPSDISSGLALSIDVNGKSVPSNITDFIRHSVLPQEIKKRWVTPFGRIMMPRPSALKKDNQDDHKFKEDIPLDESGDESLSHRKSSNASSTHNPHNTASNIKEKIMSRINAVKENPQQLKVSAFLAQAGGMLRNRLKKPQPAPIAKDEQPAADAEPIEETEVGIKTRTKSFSFTLPDTERPEPIRRKSNSFHDDLSPSPPTVEEESQEVHEEFINEIDNFLMNLEEPRADLEEEQHSVLSTELAQDSEVQQPNNELPPLPPRVPEKENSDVPTKFE
ncbi:hypothetical protein MP638_005815 [Amoeboaphelidium occidentale]|nr:hypothetical protein MP638_005815 [Amoeboaphelidium occidentale]